MKIALLTLLFFCALTSCTHNQASIQEQISQKTDFEQYVESIPILELPFELSTNDTIAHIPIENPFLPEGAALLGRLQSNNDKHLILYSYPADIRLPILEIYNSKGEKLNTLPLFDYGKCPLTASGYSRFEITDQGEIYKETACDLYDSRIDTDTIFIEKLLQND